MASWGKRSKEHQARSRSLFLRNIDLFLDEIKGGSFAGLSEEIETALRVRVRCCHHQRSLYRPGISSQSGLGDELKILWFSMVFYILYYRFYRFSLYLIQIHNGGSLWIGVQLHTTSLWK